MRKAIPISALAAVTFLTACSGGGSTDDEGFASGTRAPIGSPAGLAVDTDDTEYDVVILTPNGSEDGTFTPSTQQALFGSTSLAAIDGSVNDGLSDTRLLEGGAVALTEPTGTAPSGRVSYFGAGTLLVTDGLTPAEYEGTALVTLSLRLDGSASGTLEYEDFTGVRREGVNETDVSGGTLRIRGIRANENGLSAGNANRLSGFGDAALSDDFDFDLSGAFAGADYSETAGTISIDNTDTGSAVQGTFAATR